MAVDAVGSLGKMDFLNLLATQLSNQDPINPTDNSQFIAQLAQFSALEAAQNTDSSVTQMSKQESQLYATALLGHKISGVSAATKTPFSGTVTGVAISGGTPVVYINSLAVSLSDIQTIQ